MRSWASEENSPEDFNLLREQIEYFGEHLFSEYKPAKRPGERKFVDRLSDWLNSADNESDQKVLFRLVSRILFVGSSEFDSLYQAAFNGPIVKWLVEQLDLKLVLSCASLCVQIRP